MKARREFTSDEEYNKYLRIFISAMAMQGMLANPEIMKTMIDAIDDPNQHADFLSKAAIEQADSLLSQLQTT